MNGDLHPMTELFDHVRFTEVLMGIADSRGISNRNQLAIAIGVNGTSLARICGGLGVECSTLLRIVAWSNIDLRKYVRTAIAMPHPVHPALAEEVAS